MYCVCPVPIGIYPFKIVVAGVAYFSIVNNKKNRSNYILRAPNVGFKTKQCTLFVYYFLGYTVIVKEILYQRNKYHVTFCNLENVLHTPLSFYATQIINSFLSSMISANYYKVEGFQLIVKSLYTSYCFFIVESLLLYIVTKRRLEYYPLNLSLSKKTI